MERVGIRQVLSIKLNRTETHTYLPVPNGQQNIGEGGEVTRRYNGNVYCSAYKTACQQERAGVRTRWAKTLVHEYNFPVRRTIARNWRNVYYIYIFFYIILRAPYKWQYIKYIECAFCLLGYNTHIITLLFSSVYTTRYLYWKNANDAKGNWTENARI